MQDFALQPHSTSQTFAKFLNAEKMAKCLGTWRIYLQSERTALTFPLWKGFKDWPGGQVERALYRGPIMAPNVGRNPPGLFKLRIPLEKAGL